MSAANVELVRWGYEAVVAGDFEPIAAMPAPDVRWHGGDPDFEGACHNREQALRFMRRAREGGRVGRLLDVIDAGDRVVVVMQPLAADGSPDRPQRANVTTFQGGLVVEIVVHETPAAACAAAGVTAV
jgi:ketosteroid isomerase-like protein